MIWIEIILFSVTAGAVLFFINKVDSAKSRKLYYLIFIIMFSVLITIAAGLRARIDTSNIIFGYIVPSILLSVVLCSEAILVSIGIRKLTNKANTFLYFPLFLLSLWVVSFLTMAVAVSIYPGS
jgi:hypothetical protein